MAVRSCSAGFPDDQFRRQDDPLVLHLLILPLRIDFLKKQIDPDRTDQFLLHVDRREQRVCERVSLNIIHARHFRPCRDLNVLVNQAFHDTDRHVIRFADKSVRSLIFREDLLRCMIAIQIAADPVQNMIRLQCQVRLPQRAPVALDLDPVGRQLRLRSQAE